MSEEAAAFDEFLEQCSDRDRRTALAVLVEEGRALTLQDLSKAVVRHARSQPLDETSGDVLSQIYLSLHHCHVPKLEAGGLVSYDAARNRVALTEAVSQWDVTLVTILEHDPTLDRPVGL